MTDLVCLKLQCVILPIVLWSIHFLQAIVKVYFCLSLVRDLPFKEFFGCHQMQISCAVYTSGLQVIGMHQHMHEYEENEHL